MQIFCPLYEMCQSTWEHKKTQIWVNTVTAIQFKQQEGIQKPASLISARPTELIKNEIWEKDTAQQYEGQEKLEQDVV